MTHPSKLLTDSLLTKGTHGKRRHSQEMGRVSSRRYSRDPSPKASWSPLQQQGSRVTAADCRHQSCDGALRSTQYIFLFFLCEAPQEGKEGTLCDHGCVLVGSKRQVQVEAHNKLGCAEGQGSEEEPRKGPSQCQEHSSPTEPHVS